MSIGSCRTKLILLVNTQIYHHFNFISPLSSSLVLPLCLNVVSDTVINLLLDLLVIFQFWFLVMKAHGEKRTTYLTIYVPIFHLFFFSDYVVYSSLDL